MFGGNVLSGLWYSSLMSPGSPCSSMTAENVWTDIQERNKLLMSTSVSVCSLVAAASWFGVLFRSMIGHLWILLMVTLPEIAICRILFDHLSYPLYSVSVWGPCFKMTTPDLIVPEWLRNFSDKTMLTGWIGQHNPQNFSPKDMHGTSWDLDFGVTMPQPTTVVSWPWCSWQSGRQYLRTSFKDWWTAWDGGLQSALTPEVVRPIISLSRQFVIFILDSKWILLWQSWVSRISETNDICYCVQDIWTHIIVWSYDLIFFLMVLLSLKLLTLNLFWVVYNMTALKLQEVVILCFYRQVLHLSDSNNKPQFCKKYENKSRYFLKLTLAR